MLETVSYKNTYSIPLLATSWMLLNAAIWGYHNYKKKNNNNNKKYWNPKSSKKLICSHETDNPFDVFAIRACYIKGNRVGHLPHGISGVKKFFLVRGADITAALTETHYRRSPLKQVGF